MALMEVLPKLRDHVGLNLALVQTEVLPKFCDHMGLEMPSHFWAKPDIGDDTIEEENERKEVRTEGAGRSDKTARGGASRQGTHPKK